MSSNKFIPTNKNIFKIAIRTLELAFNTSSPKVFLQKSSSLHFWQCPKYASARVQSLKRVWLWKHISLQDNTGKLFYSFSQVSLKFHGISWYYLHSLIFTNILAFHIFKISTKLCPNCILINKNQIIQGNNI